MIGVVADLSAQTGEQHALVWPERRRPVNAVKERMDHLDVVGLAEVVGDGRIHRTGHPVDRLSARSERPQRGSVAFGATPAVAQVPYQDNGLRVAIPGRLEQPLDRLAGAARIRGAGESRYSAGGHGYRFQRSALDWRCRSGVPARHTSRSLEMGVIPHSR
jgi:hypothetical protein